MDKYNETLEKAKAYDEALKLMRDCIPDEDGLVHVRPSDIFSELAKSGDERIRKRLIFDFQALEKTEWGGLEVKDILAWLEKLKVFAEHGDGLYHFGNNVFTYVGNPTWDNVSWLEKQGTSYTKMDVDDAFFEGMAFAKNELEKQKPAWSKKDDVMVHDILGWLPAKSRPEYNQRRVDWLKSLKDRVQPQPKQEWKQENREELTEFENAMMHIGGSFFGENAGLDPNDTDKIKEQAELLLELAPKTEWSEEDERNLRRAIRTTKVVYPVTADWLESIKQRHTWKPSDEQMEVLVWCRPLFIVPKLKGILESLINDLKKLKGE